MTILESDIKLLKSAVMADTSDGGGAMTGTEVVDGTSNNIFPDTSELDRSLGRVNMRKVFGVAQTNTTDTLLGAHAIITDAPDDPLVGCLLMESTAWADTRTNAKAKIEQYLVKGPRYSCRLFDTHYAGSMQVRLYTPGAIADFPSAGDAIVLRNPGGTEQYVRVRKTTQTTQTYNVIENSAAVTVTATIVTCELGSELQYDFTGAPMARALSNEVSTYASVYSTTTAAGAKFYGIKPLGVDVDTGDVSLTTSGGIYAPLVPAATTETPIIDQAPYQGKRSLSRTSLGFYENAVGFTTNLGPNAVVQAPTAVEPGTITLTRNAFIFVDDGVGNLTQQGSTTAVAAVDYYSGSITFLASSPSYGSSPNTFLKYKPATSAVLSTYSSELVITSANQGLAFTQAFEPPPAPGTFTLSYMSQGRWYDLTDNGNGKVAGSDNSYGVGTLSYGSGSLGVTLGAIPDVGSVLLANWGETNEAVAVTGTKPTRAYATVELAAGTFYDTLTITWTNGGSTTYTATLNTSTGQLSGNATGTLKAGVLTFYPGFFPPSNQISVTSNKAPVSSAFTSLGSGQYQLSDFPVKAGSVSATVVFGTYPTDMLPIATALRVYDKGDGVIYTVISQNTSGATLTTAKAFASPTEVAIGTVNYTTGVVQLNASVTASVVVATKYTSGGGDFAPIEYYRYSKGSRTINLSALSGFNYASGSTSSSTTVYTITEWVADTPDYGNAAVVTTDVLITLGGEIYTVKDGVVRKGWDAGTGTATVANAGSMSSDGRIVITSLPTADKTNALVWYNVANMIGAKESNHGVFRTSSAPLKTGVFQLQRGASVTTGNDSGVLSGGGLSGSIDYTRGIVRWTTTSGTIFPSDFTYNAVFLQFLPLDADLLGLETSRLPLDGKVPIFRQGGIVILHNTQPYSLPNPLTKGTAYSVGRVRVAAMKVKTATGATVSSTLYTTDLDAGTITFPVGSDLTGLAQPFTVDHRIEDMMLCSVADISGKLTFTRAITHDYPAATSFVSSALVIGDVFARAYNNFEQSSWTSVWSDSLIGGAPTANYNETLNPIQVTNDGAITERWALIFTNTTTFNIVGEKTGVIGTGTTGTTAAPVNPATGKPYFTIASAGWGTGWATGNVYRFNTAACGAPFWIVRTVLQGPATLEDDKFTLAFRGDVDRP